MVIAIRCQPASFIFFLSYILIENIKKDKFVIYHLHYIFDMQLKTIPLLSLYPVLMNL